jgi:hypothetical protein
MESVGKLNLSEGMPYMPLFKIWTHSAVTIQLRNNCLLSYINVDLCNMVTLICLYDKHEQ